MNSSLLFAFGLTLVFALGASSPIENEDLVDRNEEEPPNEEIKLQLCKLLGCKTYPNILLCYLSLHRIP
jgi:hypothetical protein